ncbi:alcohol dehydrogenase catalytic domain-containing protein [Rhodovulum euryhalinum]|uniref:Threonine dehydrogenase-like Zn-dependent dehydrogenase n=1 Tax=Rhodovulum euryhalinum TaxID=35805 RepID=A0A4R2KIH1_9RHOB|nr:alcohol dehydrogenase catalytic domain-containing protein [Rhodovulum euryhalinum]TCO70349.1 threonine dehydrogenase-like Zn-dependent dehydrogenase [Rhodovulum euryhalinum]
MRAILYPARDRVEVTDLPAPRPAEGEVVVAMRASGICHTDIEVLRGNYGRSAFPLVPGHEYAGVIAELGPGVTGLAVGDRVVVDPNIECGTCRACRRGWAHLCESLGAYGVTANGGFAEFGAVRAGAVHPIGDLPFPIAALAEPMGCVLNGVAAADGASAANALVFGAGPIGLLMAIALRTRGVADIALTDLDETRLALAESFGFTPVAAGSAALERLHHGVDLAVDATGVPAVAGRLTRYIANGGTGLFFGVCPSDARIEIAPFELFRRQLRLAGSHSLNHNIPEALAAIRACGPDIGRLVSHQVPLDEIARILSDHPPPGSLKIQAVC